MTTESFGGRGKGSESSDAVAESPATPMALLRGFGIFLGWLSGALVGITALFYAVGFLASISRLNFLGLNIFLFGYDPSVYLARGANATFFFAIQFGRILIVLSPFLVVYPIVRRAVTALSQRIDGPFERLPLGSVAKKFWRPAIYSMLFLYIYFVLDLYFPQFGEYLRIEGVLQHKAPLSAESEPRLRDLLCGDFQKLESRFLILCVITLVSGAFTFWAYRLTQDMHYRQILMFPFLAISFMFIFILPGVYGVTILDREISQVRIKSPDGDDSSSLYLIGRGAEDLVTWDAETLHFRFFRSGHITNMTIRPPVPIHSIHPGLKAECAKKEAAKNVPPRTSKQE